MFHEGNVCLIFKVQLTIIIINIDSRGGCCHTLNFLQAWTLEQPYRSFNNWHRTKEIPITSDRSESQMVSDKRNKNSFKLHKCNADIYHHRGSCHHWIRPGSVVWRLYVHFIEGVHHKRGLVVRLFECSICTPTYRNFTQDKLTLRLRFFP